jgi:asparagine synthase (glutamine-hydrolysing)
MCGIAGFWDVLKRHDKQQLDALVTPMRDAILHRGPDGAANWVDANAGIAFGHRRLAIIDLTEHGQQPMLAHDARYSIIFNGEIYNHHELRQELAATGAAPIWRGHSDTEIMLAAFSAWGIVATLKKLVGMFAIALWDSKQQLLYLIRDRMGEKPLYYGWCNNYLLFGSELKSLKAHVAWQAEIDPQALNLFMRYNCIPAPFTIYKDIKKIEPGHMLVINSDKNITAEAYWSLQDIIAQQTPFVGSDSDAVNTLHTKLATTIKQQMVSDVPLGAFLSGGIDSSTIVALMQEQSSKPVKTFTIGFAEQNYNEAEIAKAIAQHLGTQHTELYLSPEQTRNTIPDMANFYDEPFADASQIPTYIVSKLTRQHVTVSLSGDGGDELFAGYNRYTWVPAIWNKIGKLPQPLRSIIAKAITALPPHLWDSAFKLLQPMLPGFARQNNAGDKMHKLARILDAATPQQIYHRLISHWYDNEALVLQARNFDIATPQLPTDAAQALVPAMMYIDSKRYLPDDILVKVDRAAMAVSLETRIPFLDHRIVEFAWSLPLNMKLRNGQTKWIVRQLLQRYVPTELIERPKMGFGVPIDQWLRGPLKEWAHDLLDPKTLSRHNLLDSNLIAKKWREHLSGVRNWQYQLWDVLMFQTWYEAQHG